MSLNLHIKRKHKGGNKSDRERYARDVFLALKNNKPIPETKLIIPDDFMEEVQNEFERLKKIDFEEEFDPNNLFRYNTSNFENFEEVLDSHSCSDDEDDDGEEEDEYDEDEYEDADSISVGKKTKKTSKKKTIRKGSSVGSQEDIEVASQDEKLSILSGAKSEGIGRREPLQ